MTSAWSSSSTPAAWPCACARAKWPKRPNSSRPRRGSCRNARGTTVWTVWTTARKRGPGAARCVWMKTARCASKPGRGWNSGAAARGVSGANCATSGSNLPDDSFAVWALGEDRRDERTAASRFVSPEMTGAEDLERHGRWEDHPEYGAFWVPFEVRAGWAPYRYGRWTWVRPWGWTWVDEAPWGFAPFHYGRWVHWRGRWGWLPGSYVGRPVFAPALVAWVGGSAQAWPGWPWVRWTSSCPGTAAHRFTAITSTSGPIAQVIGRSPSARPLAPSCTATKARRVQ
jgi:hypothetical protein